MKRRSFSNLNESVACFVKRFLLNHDYHYNRIYRERRWRAGVAGATIKFYHIQNRKGEALTDYHFEKLNKALQNFRCKAIRIQGAYSWSIGSLKIKEFK